jgi:hypothetical protein
MEKAALRQVIRGRDIARERQHATRSPLRLIWPYRPGGGKWVLDDLSACPNVRTYLEQHRELLASRPRLAFTIKRNPSTWYRFIDPGRSHRCGVRIAVADIFRDPAFAVVEGPLVATMNTCFEIVPKPGQEGGVLRALEDHHFWERLYLRSRSLRNGYRRTSVKELRCVPLTCRDI